MAIIYLIGNPININTFCNAEMVAKYYGHTVINPLYAPDILTIQEAMIDASDAVLLLEGWKNSESARRQYSYSQTKNHIKTEIRYNASNQSKMQKELQDLKKGK